MDESERDQVDPLEVTFTYTRKESRQLQKLAGTRPQLLPRVVLLLQRLAVSVIWIMFVLFVSEYMLTFGGPGLALCIGMVIVSGPRIAYAVASAVRRHPVSSPVTVRLTERGLIMQYTTCTSEMLWSSVTSVRKGEFNTLIFETSGRPLIIPLRAFANDTIAAHFEQQAVEWHSAERSAPQMPVVLRSSEGLSVTYAATRDDIVHAHWYHLRILYLRSTLLAGASQLALACLICIVFWYAASTLANGSPVRTSMIVLPLPIGAFLFWTRISPRRTLRHWESTPGSMEPRTLVLRQEGAQFISHGSNLYVWSTFVAVRTDSRLIYFVQPRREGAYFVPRAAFPDAASADHFVAAANAYLKGTEPPAAPQRQDWPPPPSVR